MASLCKEKKSGQFRVLFVLNGIRRTVRLGGFTQRDSEKFLELTEKLVAARALDTSLDSELVTRLARIDIKFRKKLAKVGLLEMPGKSARDATIEDFITKYIDSRQGVSPHTKRIWRQTARKLSEHFGKRRLISTITQGDATEWRSKLEGAGMAEASVRKHCNFAKHFFAQAVDFEIIQKNPFGKLVSSSIGNESRQFFVTKEMTQKIIDSAPSAEWRLIIALSRYGGLRCPSEHFELKWSDVDWEQGRLRVTSPKTSRHEGHGMRVIPIFPELRPYLEESFELAKPGSVEIIQGYRKCSGNLRTQMKRIVERAGFEAYPRIFHNLRSSRQTELVELFPEHVVCKWIGNSQQVAKRHYLQVTDDHFERAVSLTANDAAKTAHLCAQHVAASSVSELHGEHEAVQVNPSKTLKNEGFSGNLAVDSKADARKLAEVHGNRIVSSRHGKNKGFDKTSQSAVHICAHSDSRLNSIVDVWQKLKEPDREAIFRFAIKFLE